METWFELVDVERFIGGAKVVSVVDHNILLGAAGNAVQNMNLVLGLPETARVAPVGI